MNPIDPRGAAPTAPMAEALRSWQQGLPELTLARCGELFTNGRLQPGEVAAACELAGDAAHALGRADMAVTLWRQAAAHAAAGSAAAPLRKAALLRAHEGDTAQAEALYRDALADDPDDATTHANLGVLLAGQRRHAEAEAAYRAALARSPGNAITWTNLGVLLAALWRPAEAEACHRQALALAPDDVSVLTNLGLLLQAQRLLDEAEACQRRAIALAPLSAEVRTNLGNLLAERGQPVEAESQLRDALALAPDSAASHMNLGVLCADQQRDAEAEAWLRSALALRPAYPLAQLNLSRVLLVQGRYEEGWRLHEARHDPRLPDNGIAPPDLSPPLPVWRGEPLAGRKVLVWAEQGLGDQLQFCRYVPWLKQQGAARVTLVCQRPLAALFATLPGADAVVPADVVDNAFQVTGTPLGNHDVWTFPLSLPHRAGTTLAALPAAPIPYLHAEPARVADWAARWQAEEAHDAVPRPLRVGLVWRGNPRHDNDAERSLPSASVLAPLAALPGVRCASLQAGRAAQLAHVLDWGLALHDFADTAAAVCALDLLICVDTSIAHLAGALGRPCWVLLPHHRTDWRWLRDRDDTPWYPTLRLFRQPARGAWAMVIAEVLDALEGLSRGR